MYQSAGCVNFQFPGEKHRLMQQMSALIETETSQEEEIVVREPAFDPEQPTQNVRMNNRIMTAGLGISDTGVASLYNKGWFPKKKSKLVSSNSIYKEMNSGRQLTVGGFACAPTVKNEESLI